MKHSIILFLILIVSQACNNSKPAELVNQTGIHKVIVEEVIQTSQYTYVLTKEDNVEQWIAIPGMKVEIGSSYYYRDGLLMSNFKSQELNRVFEKIIFIEKLLADYPSDINEANSSQLTHSGKVTTEKADVKVEIVEGGISIAELFSKKTSYNGKRVKVSGVVAKYNPAIMDKNWIHLQDGTNFEGNFDLTITSDAVVNKGDIVTFEGIIVLDKDFGFGYFYDVLMEEGKIIP